MLKCTYDFLVMLHFGNMTQKKMLFKELLLAFVLQALPVVSFITAPVSIHSKSCTQKLESSLYVSTYPVSYYVAFGKRFSMEDDCFFSESGDFAAVFDGHGGKGVVQYLSKNLYPTTQDALLQNLGDKTNINKNDEDSSFEKDLKAGLNWTVHDYRIAIELALKIIDDKVQRNPLLDDEGSTVTAVWLHENCIEKPSKKTIIAANIGDSRAVLCRGSTALVLTKDHKPNDPSEKERIEQLGGTVAWFGDVDETGAPVLEKGAYRINGDLALSRAVGDKSERPYVCAEPDIILENILNDQDKFIILATDGLWDVFSNERAIEYVLSLEAEGHTREKIPSLMVKKALKDGSRDNITVVIVWLD